MLMVPCYYRRPLRAWSEEAGQCRARAAQKDEKEKETREGERDERDEKWTSPAYLYDTRTALSLFGRFGKESQHTSRAYTTIATSGDVY